MFRTLSCDKAIGCKPNIIQHGTLFITKDAIVKDANLHRIIEELQQANESESYGKKIDSWIKNSVCVTALWIGNTSDLREKGTDVIYESEFGQPQPEILLTIVPTSPLETIELNIKNIISAIKHIGTFEEYKENYLKYLKEHEDSMFKIDVITEDINDIVSKNSYSDFYKFTQYSSRVYDWYNAFQNKEESLNINDYKIWLNRVKGVKLYSQRDNSMRLRRLCYFLDESKDVLNAARGYLNNKKIPFLEGLKESLLEEVAPITESNNASSSEINSLDVKLHWSCKPAIAGYIISELIRAGYIEPPTTNGELSYAKLATICNQIFKISGKDGKPTTLDYLKKSVNPESNSLPDSKRAKLKMPDLTDLT